MNPIDPFLKLFNQKGAANIRRTQCAGMLLAALIAAAILYIFIPPFFLPKRQADIPVLPGSGAREIARVLQKEGMLTFRAPFLVLSKVTGLHRKLKAGLYRMNSRLSLWDLLDVLSTGKSELLILCVPEGHTAYQVAQMASYKKIVSAEDFMRAVESEEMAKSLEIPASRLEGFLFPETYRVPLGVSPDALISLMVNYFKRTIGKDYIEKARRQGLTYYQAVILASIVEKEAMLESERPVIAGVMLNRLRKNMRLEVNATLNYVLDSKRAWLTNDQLSTRSPYNTYLRRGLPPSPICNPGRTSLKAVVEPADTGALFYVALGDGSHLFADTFEQHRANIQRVKRLRRLKPRNP
jgi:UPF0755 protein